MKNKENKRQEFMRKLEQLLQLNRMEDGYLSILSLVDDYMEELYKHELKIADDRWKSAERRVRELSKIESLEQEAERSIEVRVLEDCFDEIELEMEAVRKVAITGKEYRLLSLLDAQNRIARKLMDLTSKEEKK